MGRISSIDAAVNAGCAEALPLAGMTRLIPKVGNYVAAGVTVGCNTAAGIARLRADPSSAAWLGQQAQIMKGALGKR
jgi:hypothetical protein